MMALDERPLGETLDRRQRWLLLISLMSAMFMGALDQTIMATAAPKIVANLGGFSLLSWVFTTYMLTSTVVGPLVGKLSDIYGRKPFLLAGMVIFLIASAGCGAAPNMAVLIACRGLQGIGGGAVFASIFATVGDIFAPAERGKYMGLFTGTFSLASVLGPAIGGLLTDHAGWRWVFFINVPVGAVAFPAIWRNLPLVRSSRRPQIDFIGAALLSLSTSCGLLALAWSGTEYGWASAPTLALFAGAAAFGAAFVAQELRHPAPIIPFHLFRNREFLLGNLMVLCTGFAMMGAIPYLPTFLQVALDESATASGLITTPQSLGLLVTSIVGGQLLSRTGRYKPLTISGSVMMVGAMGLMLTLSPTTPTWQLSLFVVLLGLGGGLVMPTLSVVIQNAVSHAYLGVATSARQFFMQIGAVIGTALFGVLLTTTFQAQFRQHVPAQTRAAVAAETLARFEDPTLALDPAAYAKVQAELLAQPDGSTHLANARDAQRSAISEAIRRVFALALALIAVALALALLMKERPLRRTLGPAEPGEPAGELIAAAALSPH
ncbi:MAG TPA: MDR family MFS transporter [Dehalococcoidia bacterium]|nr:MDR family MFS transporter [Dehalococcoidia bacterium]